MMIRAVVVAFALTVQPAAAYDFGAPCRNLSDSLQTLKSHQGETLQFTGADSDGRVLLVTVNPRTKTWTIAVMPVDPVRFCPVLTGRHFQTYDQERFPLNLE